MPVSGGPLTQKITWRGLNCLPDFPKWLEPASCNNVDDNTIHLDACCNVACWSTVLQVRELEELVLSHLSVTIGATLLVSIYFNSPKINSTSVFPHQVSVLHFDTIFLLAFPSILLSKSTTLSRLPAN